MYNMFQGVKRPWKYPRPQSPAKLASFCARITSASWLASHKRSRPQSSLSLRMTSSQPQPQQPQSLVPEIVYSCEICGQDDLSEVQMRLHMERVHLKGAVQCPFCDLSSSDVTASEMTLHVNSAHLEYLTPEREDVAFLEDTEDFDSIWQLEKDAKEGLTNGVDQSPTGPNGPKNNLNHAYKKNMDSPMSTCEVMSTSEVMSASEASESSPCHSVTSSGAIQKRFKVSNSSNHESPSKSGLSLNIRPSWASNALLECPLCSFKVKEPSKLEEHVNRAHFDPASPNNQGPEKMADNSDKMAENNSDLVKTPSSLPCPLCSACYTTSLELERHVNRDHTDVLSPMTTKKQDLDSSSSTTAAVASSLMRHSDLGM